jgi:hypothetical protein
MSVIGIFGAVVLFSSLDTKTEGQIVEDQSVMAFNDAYRIAMPPIPEQVYFCNEEVPLDQWEVRERLEREMLSNTYWQSNTVLLLKRSGRYFPLIEKILEEEGVPQDFKYLAVAESGLTQAVSSAGARGMWQFMKSTGTAYDLTINGEIDERYHIEKATRSACTYLKKAKTQLGSWTLAAAAYNRGLPGIKRDLANQKVDSYYALYLNRETSRYVFRILAYKLIMSNPEAYGFQLTDSDYYTPVQTRSIEVDTTIASLADYAQLNKTDYKTIKLLNPWLRSSRLTVKSGDTYTIQLPE